MAAILALFIGQLMAILDPEFGPQTMHCSFVQVMCKGIVRPDLPSQCRWDLTMSVRSEGRPERSYLNIDMLHKLEELIVARGRYEALQVAGHAYQHVLQGHVPKHVLRRPFPQA